MQRKGVRVVMTTTNVALCVVILWCIHLPPFTIRFHWPARSQFPFLCLALVRLSVFATASPTVLGRTSDWNGTESADCTSFIADSVSSGAQLQSSIAHHRESFYVHSSKSDLLDWQRVRVVERAKLTDSSPKSDLGLCCM
jgi:hypothetical protein